MAGIPVVGLVSGGRMDLLRKWHASSLWLMVPSWGTS